MKSLIRPSVRLHMSKRKKRKNERMNIKWLISFPFAATGPHKQSLRHKKRNGNNSKQNNKSKYWVWSIKTQTTWYLYYFTSPFQASECLCFFFSMKCERGKASTIGLRKDCELWQITRRRLRPLQSAALPLRLPVPLAQLWRYVVLYYYSSCSPFSSISYQQSLRILW